ncbi:hypothetical protein EMPS_04360 [Entomortierella parvispora]|uniref:Transcription activator GCR1-like domain-containing protein n=1 Tax=Entomortierella parvispora TaxID=205924 RepID=A0A9P3H919_9FUNG|nr:hypothetical protein EMPS_04360 [Entomortierella parvispora]
MDLEESKSGVNRDIKQESPSRPIATKRKRRQPHLILETGPVGLDSDHLKERLMENGIVVDLRKEKTVESTERQQQQQLQKEQVSERWCEQQGFLDCDKVTKSKLALYSKEFVLPMERAMNELTENPRMNKLCGTRVFLKPVQELQAEQQIGQGSQKQKQQQPPSLQLLINNDSEETTTSTASTLPLSLPCPPKVVLLNSNLFQQQQQGKARQQLQQLEQSGGPIRFNAQEFLIPLRKRGPQSGTLAAGVSPYVLNRNVATVRDVLAEWRYGVEGGRAIQDHVSISRRAWGIARDRYEYTVRSAIVEEFVRAVKEDGQSEEEAIERLEALRKRRLSSIYGAILEEREVRRRHHQGRERDEL